MSTKHISRYSATQIDEKIAKGQSRTDWARVDAMADEDIERAMRSDPDWADHIDVNWDDAVIVRPALKKALSIRLDQDVIDFFQSTGKGYQTRMNAVLRHFMTYAKENENK